MAITVLTTKQICERLQISSTSLGRLRAEGLIRVYKVRSMVRYVLEEVLEDLHKAQSELPLRKLRGTLIRSGGPRVGRGKHDLLGHRARDNVLNLESDEAEKRLGIPAKRDKA